MSAKIPANLVIDVYIGESVIKLNLFNWLKSRDLFNKGDNKLFQAIEGLDEKNLCLEVTEGMRELGIEAIVSPKTHQKIKANQIVFLDDKPGVVALQKKAGFKAILADTFENKWTATINTYLDMLKNEIEFIIPKDVTGNMKTKTTRNIEGKKLTATLSGGRYTYYNKQSKKTTVPVPSDIISFLKSIDVMIRNNEELNKKDLSALLNISKKLCKKRKVGSNREHIVSFFETVCREIEGLISIHELKNISTKHLYPSQLKRKFEYLLLKFLKQEDKEIIDMMVKCLAVNNLNGNEFKKFYRDLVNGNEI